MHNMCFFTSEEGIVGFYDFVRGGNDDGLFLQGQRLQLLGILPGISRFAWWEGTAAWRQLTEYWFVTLACSSKLNLISHSCLLLFF